jgi:cyclic pyranopterin monophosphate synthase
MVVSRRMMMMANARTALLSTSCRPRTVTLSCTIIRTRAAAAGRWYTSFGANNKDHGDDSSSSSMLSAMDQHRMFLEQMNELQAEQRQLFGASTDPVEFDFGSSMMRQSQQQPQQQQHQIDDDKEGEECSMTPAEHEAADNDDDDDLLWERKKQDRELLYGFTEQEHVAWANHGRSNQHDDDGANRLTMEEIIRYRAAHFARLDRQAEDSPEGEVASTTPLSQQQQDGSTSSTSAPNFALSHVSADGSTLHMVDVGEKPLTTRIATAETIVQFPSAVVTALRKSSSNDNGELLTKKGPVFATAITAGIMAAKQTSNLIPLCHPLFLSKVDVTIDWVEEETASRDNDNGAAAVRVTCTCKVASGPTGVEMEALVGCSVAALTIYDMVKAVSHDVVILQTRLLHKEGGKRHFDIRHRPTTTTN